MIGKKVFIDGNEIKNKKDIDFSKEIIKIDGCKEKILNLFGLYNKEHEVDLIINLCLKYKTYKVINYFKVAEFPSEGKLIEYLEFIKHKKTISVNLAYFKIIYSEEKAIKENIKRTIKLKNRSTPNTIIHWEKKGFSLEESKQKILDYKTRQGCSKEKFIKRHGEKIGIEKYNEWLGKCVNTKENFIKRNGEIEGKIKWEKYLPTKDSSSINWAYKKSGGNYKKAKKIFKEKTDKTTLTFEKFKKKFPNLKEEEIKKKWREKFDTGSLDSFQRKYGNEAALKKYLETCNKKDNSSLKYFLRKNNDNLKVAIEEFKAKTKKTDTHSLYYFFKKNNRNIKKAKEEFIERSKKLKYTKTGSASKTSLKIFSRLKEHLIFLEYKKEDIYLGDNEGSEYYIFFNKSLRYYDFTLLSEKIIIEFNGVLFHPNYETNSEFIPMCDFSKSKEELIAYEKEKLQLAKNNGFSVLVIWEEDSYQKNWNKIINFLKEKNIIK